MANNRKTHTISTYSSSSRVMDEIRAVSCTGERCTRGTDSLLGSGVLGVAPSVYFVFACWLKLTLHDPAVPLHPTLFPSSFSLSFSLWPCFPFPLPKFPFRKWVRSTRLHLFLIIRAHLTRARATRSPIPTQMMINVFLKGNGLWSFKSVCVSRRAI